MSENPHYGNNLDKRTHRKAWWTSKKDYADQKEETHDEVKPETTRQLF